MTQHSGWGPWNAWATPARRSRLIVCCSLAGFGALVGCTTADPAAKSAAATEQMCSACHGPDGTTRSARAPVLASQPQIYLVAQLKAFRDHSRADSGARDYMWPMAAALSDPMIESLATHFSALPPVPAERASATDVADGKDFYEKGAAERGIPACGSCHGDKAQGLALFPRLAGQHADYLSAQLAALADNSRTNPIMGPIAMKMSSKEAQSVVAYLAAQ